MKIKYATETFGPSFSETVLGELDTRFSRTQGELAPAEGDLPFGLVLIRNEDGTYAPYAVSEAPEEVQTLNDQEAEEGENGQSSKETEPEADGEACAVLLSPVQASEDPQTALILRGFAILNGANLLFDKSVTDRKTALSQLEKHNFIIENIPEAENGFTE